MADVVDKATRSRMMSGIQAKDTLPELQVRSVLHRAGFRFQMHRRDLPGKPDLVLPKYHVAIFVNGCFWHQHAGCGLAAVPKTNKKFWQVKLSGNVARDKRVRARLRRAGWHAFTIWECETNEHGLSKLMSKIARAVQ